MGSATVSLIRNKNQRIQATEQLLRDLSALKIMLENGMFETGIQRIGAEQELSLVRNDWKTAPVAMQLLDKVNDKRFTTEFARFNLEINLDPLEFGGDCFTRMERSLWRLLTKGEQAAAGEDAHLILAGIVPTIRRSDIDIKNMTPLPRYRNIADAFHETRGDSFEFRIEGKDSWISRAEDSFIESCNTSFQVHYQLDPADFVSAYNWALAVAAPLLSCTANSPLLLGKRLWRETRIALFEQSTDLRSSAEQYRNRLPRVSFGSGWVQHSVLELFRNNAFRQRILMASTRQEDSLEVLEAGGVPGLYGLCAHEGTVYNWHRACYGITNGKPHLRIENRILPAGPTIADEVANAAFWLGLMKGMPSWYSNIRDQMKFDDAKRNFHLAARLGLGANFYWPGFSGQVPAPELITNTLLPIAREGLKMANIDQQDADRLLNIIEQRTKTGKTGAQWMLDSFEKLQQQASKDEALTALTAGMSKRQQEGSPVHTWNLPELKEAGYRNDRFWTIEQIMQTELITVSEDDPVQLVTNIMSWQNIRHMPVENRLGEIVGIVTTKNLMHFYCNHQNGGSPTPVREIMETRLITVTPQTKTLDALALLKKHNIGCLPVLQGKKLAGLVTERDFTAIVSDLIRTNSACENPGEATAGKESENARPETGYMPQLR